MNPNIVEKPAIKLVGLSFYGNPFETKDPWTEENEIGQLWHRFMDYMQKNPAYFSDKKVHMDALYEVHIIHSNTLSTGEFEIFVGVAIAQIEEVPVECVVKVLPHSLYAVFTMEGEDINQDWRQQIYHDWLPQSGYTSGKSYSFQLYDHRFKGMDNLAESVLDVYIPIKTSSEK